MICNNCDKLNDDKSKYCCECGELLSLNDNNKKPAFKSYKTLRGFNWAFSLLLLLGVALFLASAKSSSLMVFGSLAFLISILGNYLGTAIALNPGGNIIMGIPIILNPESIWISVLLVVNILLGLFGLIIIIACLYTLQYGASISGFLYLFLSFANARALREIKKA